MVLIMVSKIPGLLAPRLELLILTVLGVARDILEVAMVFIKVQGKFLPPLVRSPLWVQRLIRLIFLDTVSILRAGPLVQVLGFLIL